MLFDALICLLASAALFGVWHLWFAHLNRERAAQIICWINAVLDGNGHVAELEWSSSSQFRVRLRYRQGVFRRVWMRVQLVPREFPFQWFKGLLKKERDVITVEADLEVTPGADFVAGRYRLYSRTCANLVPEAAGWHYGNSEPLVLATRLDWPKEIRGVVSTLPGCFDQHVSDISFSRNSPHFRATLALEAISPENADRTNMLPALAQLASGVSTTSSL